MLGSANDEIIYAGLGDDTLYMSTGDDRLSGGEGEPIPMWPKMSAAQQPSLIFNLTATLLLTANDQSDRIDVTAFTTLQGMDGLAIDAVGPGGVIPRCLG